MEYTTLSDVLSGDIALLLEAERSLCTVLPVVLARVSSDEVQGVLSAHLNDLRCRIVRFEELVSGLGVPEKPRLSPVVSGFLVELCAAADREGSGMLRDIAILGVLCRMKHHHMAACEMVRSLVEVLGLQAPSEAILAHLAEDRRVETTLTVLLEDFIDTVCEGELPSGFGREALETGSEFRRSSSE